MQQRRFERGGSGAAGKNATQTNLRNLLVHVEPIAK
jgi:hypothetical protein